MKINVKREIRKIEIITQGKRGIQGPQGIEGPQGDPASNLVQSVNGQVGVVVLDADDISDTSTSNKYVTSAEKTKLSNLSGVNTGDQDLSGYVPTSRTVNLIPLSSNIVLTKSDIGLSNIDNTSDANKPVSTAQASAIAIVQGDIDTHESNTSNPHFVTKSQVGLGNVDNTSDVNKPVSTAQQTALDNKLNVGTLTTAIGEGTNLYYTDVRADARITLQKAAANGLATLGSDSKIPSGQLPAIAITDTFVVASQAAMLALTAETGDVAVRTDLSKSFILTTTDPTVLANWQELLTPSDAVTSVNGQTGTVVLTTSNITEGTNLYHTTARVQTIGDARYLRISNDLSDLNSATTARTNLGLGSFATISSLAHSSLTGLSSDDHSQYSLLAGRSGGQTLKGGTGVTDVLSLVGTSGNGTSGNAAIQLKVGNNGATTALTILNSANVGIGDTSPSALLTVGSGSAFQVDSSGNITTSGDLAVNGADITSSAATANIFNVTPTTINFGGNASAINIGASGGTTITPGGSWTLPQGNAKSLTITSGLSGGARSTYPVVISQANDATNNNSVGLLQLSNSDASTAALLSIVQVAGGTGIDFAGNTSGISLQVSTTSGTGLHANSITSGTAVTANGLTSGKGLVAGLNNSASTASAVSLTSAITAITADYTGAMINIAPTRTLTAAATRTDSGNWLLLARSNTVNNASGIYNVTGDLATFSSNATQTSGTITDTSSILVLNQQFASASGTVLKVTNSGTGAAATFSAGNVGFGVTSPTALIHIKAGTATANTAPLKFTTGTNLTTPVAGTVEFTTDDLFFTITTGTARKAFVLDDGTRLTSGRVPFATTNGRLIDDSDMTFATDTLTVTKITGSTSITSPLLISTDRIRLKGYTVATLPAGTQGDTAYVTDALAPTFLATIVGGGTVVTPVFYNGTTWVGY